MSFLGSPYTEQDLDLWLRRHIFYTEYGNPPPEYAGIGSQMYEQRKKVFGASSALELWNKTKTQYEKDLKTWQEGKLNPLSDYNIERFVVVINAQNQLKKERNEFYNIIKKWRAGKIKFNDAFMEKYTA